MFLDPNQLNQYAPAEILDAASQGHIGLDHRFLHALLDRSEESRQAALAFAGRNREDDAVDLAPELIALFRHWNTAAAVPFLVRYIQEDPEHIPDEVVEFLSVIGQPALDPLLQLYDDLEETQSGEVAFILAAMRVRDDRVLKLITDRLDFDAHDTLLLLEMYGDPAAIPALEAFAAGSDGADGALREEIAALEESLNVPVKAEETKDEPFDIWSHYPERADLPMELLDDDERLSLLSHAVESVRAAAANSFFNRELTEGQRGRLLESARNDASATVRARAWEALTSATEDTLVIEAMLAALRRDDLPLEERGGLLVGLAPEADRNEVRAGMNALYQTPGGRAKALEAMWRSLHASFRDVFPKHLKDPDIEVRRGAIWGIGYHGIKGELEKIRGFFDDEDLRPDALFAYALATPAEISRGRMQSLLARIEKDARGLSEMEEELVKAALDERLMLAGKEPFFAQEED